MANELTAEQELEKKKLAGLLDQAFPEDDKLGKFRFTAEGYQPGELVQEGRVIYYSLDKIPNDTIELNLHPKDFSLQNAMDLSVDDYRKTGALAKIEAFLKENGIIKEDATIVKIKDAEDLSKSPPRTYQIEYLGISLKDLTPDGMKKLEAVAESGKMKSVIAGAVEEPMKLGVKRREDQIEKEATEEKGRERIQALKRQIEEVRTEIEQLKKGKTAAEPSPKRDSTETPSERTARLNDEFSDKLYESNQRQEALKEAPTDAMKTENQRSTATPKVEEPAKPKEAPAQPKSKSEPAPSKLSDSELADLDDKISTAMSEGNRARNEPSKANEPSKLDTAADAMRKLSAQNFIKGQERNRVDGLVSNQDVTVQLDSNVKRSAARSAEVNDTQAKIKEIFDLNNDGKVDLKEIREIAQKAGIKMENPAELARVLNQGNGQLASPMVGKSDTSSKLQAL